MDNDLEAFLCGRNVSAVIIERMKRDKIDKSVLCILSDEELAQYIPAFGDRIAVASFCRQNTVQSANRAELLERVSQKIGARRRNANSSHSSHSSDPSQAQRAQTTFLPKEKQKKKTPPEKLYRRLNIGWLHHRSIEGYRQVRLPEGGGIRAVSIERYASYEDILEKGKELFFPGRHSTKGPIEDFNFDLCDFKRAPVNKAETIHDMYQKTGLQLLRLYICTRAGESSSDEEDHEPANNDGTDNSNEEGTALTSTTAATRATRNQPLSDDDTSNSAVSNTHATETIVVPSESENESSYENASPSSSPSHSQYSTAPRSSPNNVAMRAAERQGLENASPPSSQSHSQHSTAPSSSSNNAAMRAEERQGLENASPPLSQSHSQHSTAPSSSSNNAAMRAEERQGLELESQMDTLPEQVASQPATERIVVILRLKVVEYLLDAFKDSSILNCKLKMRFVNEKARDEDGVSRDVYSAFWEQFLEQCEGEDERVPRLRPDYSEVEWAAVGRIWVKGLLDHGVLPVKLSKAFILSCIHGIDSVPNNVLLTSFLEFISPSERCALQKALQGNIDESDEDDLLDLFTRMGSHKLPSKDDLEASIQTMAHKAIIQEPKFIVDCFSKSIASSEMTLSDKDGVLGLYEKKRANGKKVARLLEPMVAMNQRESEVFNHLQRFIKNADQSKAEKILRFCTGANVICVEKIQVSFNGESGLGRRLVAHTCGPVLEVPYTYLSYPEFRVEFDNILSSNYLEMDIL